MLSHVLKSIIILSYYRRCTCMCVLSFNITSTYTIALFFVWYIIEIIYRDNTIYLGIAWKEIINESSRDERIFVTITIPHCS